MAIEVLGSGQPDGTAVVKSTEELVHLYGGTAVAQAASIAALDVSASDSTDYNANFTLVNTLIGVLEDLGVLASA